MTGFDPDAYLSQGSASAPEAFDPDAYLSKPAPTVANAPLREAPSASQHAAETFSILKRHPLTTGVGLLENVASGVTGGLGSVADAVTLSEPGTHDWAYRPRTQAGQEIAQAGADEAAALGRGYTNVAGQGPLAETIKRYGPEALGAVGTVAGLGEIPRPRGSARAAIPGTAQEVLDQSLANSPQSMGAAAAAPRMTNVSPDLQQAVVKAAQQTGGVVNPEILARHMEADSLPVKIQLTPGQAMQDPALLSREMNNRGRTSGLPELLRNQNTQLTQNLQSMRDEVGPDVFSTNPVEHADTLIKTYKDKAEAADAETTAKYQALKDANGGSFPVSAPSLLKNATSELHKELLFDHAPKAVMSTLGRLADADNMTFENFESLRTNLARIQRSKTADGNEIAAAGIIRRAMEDLPLQPGAAALKPLADTARASAKAQFDALKADPAYKAAVNDEVSPDRFVQKFITGPTATRDGLATMRENLSHDPTAIQTMGVAALDHLRNAAGISDKWEGNFTQAGFNKAAQALNPKLQSLVTPKTAEQIDTLGNVARYTQFQPRGSFVNNSNTLVGALAEHGATAAENLLNAKTGIGGTVARKIIQKRAENKVAKETMTPYGGLGNLRDVGK